MNSTLGKFELLAALITMVGTGVFGQGSLQNLDFEQANLPSIPPGQSGGYVPISSGLPGWQGFVGTNQQGTILHNVENIDTAGISILGPQYAGSPILHGNYSVVLQAGYDPYSGDQTARASAAIAQFGEVPSTTKSLQFEISSLASYFELRFDGQLVPTFLIFTASTYDVYGSDFSAYAGLSGDLSITAMPAPPYNGFNRFTLDDIMFSPQAIPEPGTFGLFSFGAMLLAWRFNRGSRV